MFPPISPAFTNSLLPVPVVAETFTDKEPTLLNLKWTSVKDKLELENKVGSHFMLVLRSKEQNENYWLSGKGIT